MRLHVMTFNTQHCKNYLTKAIDYERMAEAIRECRPDIVALNEMRDRGLADGYDDQVGILAERTGLLGLFAEAIRLDGANPYGNGLLSRFPILSAEIIPIPSPAQKRYDGYYEDRCLLKATVALEGEELTVLAVHVGLNPDEAERAIDTILKNLPKKRCVLMGDFNLTPESPYLLPIRERMRDAAALIEGSAFTYPSDAPKKKIDYIFVTEDIEIEAAEIPKIIASDHRPHTAILRF